MRTRSEESLRISGAKGPAEGSLERVRRSTIQASGQGFNKARPDVTNSIPKAAKTRGQSGRKNARARHEGSMSSCRQRSANFRWRVHRQIAAIPGHNQTSL